MARYIGSAKAAPALSLVTLDIGLVAAAVVPFLASVAVGTAADDSFFCVGRRGGRWLLQDAAVLMFLLYVVSTDDP